jgi:hypothetical protein
MPGDNILVPIPDPPGPIVGPTNGQPREGKMDPVTKAAATAQAALKVGLTYLATKAAEGAHCRPNMDDAPIMDKTFCTVVRGVAGSDATEFKNRLNSQLADIATKISEVNAKATIIVDSVNQLLKDMALTHLEINETMVRDAARWLQHASRMVRSRAQRRSGQAHQSFLSSRRRSPDFLACRRVLLPLPWIRPLGSNLQHGRAI